MRSSSLTYTAGTLDVNDIVMFRRLIFRASRGKALVNFSEDVYQASEQQKLKGSEASEKLVTKCVYLVIYEHTFLQDKIERICQSMMGRSFKLPTGLTAYNTLVTEVSQELSQTQTLAQTSCQQICQFLEELQRIPDSEVTHCAFLI